MSISCDSSLTSVRIVRKVLFMPIYDETYFRNAGVAMQGDRPGPHPKPAEARCIECGELDVVGALEALRVPMAGWQRVVAYIHGECRQMAIEWDAREAAAEEQGRREMEAS